MTTYLDNMSIEVLSVPIWSDNYHGGRLSQPTSLRGYHPGDVSSDFPYGIDYVVMAPTSVARVFSIFNAPPNLDNKEFVCVGVSPSTSAFVVRHDGEYRLHTVCWGEK